MSKVIIQNIQCPGCSVGNIESKSTLHDECVVTIFPPCNKCKELLSKKYRSELFKNKDYIGHYRKFVNRIEKQ